MLLSCEEGLFLCSCITCIWSICLHGLYFFKNTKTVHCNMATVDSHFEQSVCDHCIISSKHCCMLVYWLLVTLVYVPSLVVFALKIQCVNIRVPCNILKCAFWCLILVFNLLVLNIDLSQCTLYAVNNKSQLISTPVICRQWFKFLYFIQYPQTFNSGAEGLGSTPFWIPVRLLASLSEVSHGFPLSAGYSFAL